MNFKYYAIRGFIPFDTEGHARSLALPLAPQLVGQELRRLLRLSKAANEARLTDGVRLKDRRDGMAQALDLKALNSLVLVKVLEAPGAAHLDDTVLHLRGHEASGMTVAAK